MRIHPKIKPWLIAFGVLLLLRLILATTPKWMDSVYRNGFFKIMRWLLDKTFGILPYPGVVLFLLLLTWQALRPLIFKRKRSTKKRLPFEVKIGRFAIQLAFFFLLMWGMNYGATELQDKYDRGQYYSQERLMSALSEQVNWLNTHSIDMRKLPQLVEENELERIRIALEASLGELDFANSGNPKARLVFPESGTLRRLGISGIYFPFTGEGYVDASQPYLGQMFTAAHEMAHGYGITNEGDCNYFAYASLLRSEEIQMEYAARFVLMLHLRSNLYDLGGEVLMDRLNNALSEELQMNLDFWRQNSLEFSTWMPGVSQITNDTYLKLNGLEEGEASYNDLVYWALFLEEN